MPGGNRGFRSLEPGEPFLFKTKHPTYQLIGGGVFDDFFQLSIREAWDVWGIGNGVETFEDLVNRVNRYRTKNRLPPDSNPNIGCIVLRNLYFANPGEELPQPPYWSPQIVTGKTYTFGSDDDPDNDYVQRAFETLIYHQRLDLQWEPSDGPRFTFELTKRRRGQGSFRVAVEHAYQSRCAMTGTTIRPLLEAAHIQPYSQGGEHDVPNGILLRTDLHRLFDAGLMSIDPEFTIRVSSNLRKEYGDVGEYESLDGSKIRLPQVVDYYPQKQALEYHFTNIFAGND